MGMTPLGQARTFLLTGGRAPVTLELARQFAAVGHRVLVADSLPYCLCTDSNAVHQSFVVPSPRHNPTAFIQTLQQIIQAEQVDLLVPTCEEIFYIAAGLNALTPHCPVLAAPLHQLQSWHHKGQFIQKMQDLGMAVPQTWAVRSQSELQALLKQSIPQHLILKPAYSRFATRVRHIDRLAPTVPTLLWTPTNPWIVQEFLTGTHYCLYGVAHQGTLTAFAAYPASFTAGKGACIYFEAVEHAPLFTWMQTLVESEQFTGQIAFDVVEAEDGTLYPLECNPRTISAVHLFNPSDRLDRAFLNSTDTLIQPGTDRKAAIRLAMLLYGLPDAVANGQISSWISAMRTARGVIFQRGDPLPGLFLPKMLWQFARLSLQQRQSLQAISTQDIEWDGVPIKMEG